MTMGGSTVFTTMNLTMLVCVIVLGSVQAVEISDHSARRQSVTYADFLHETSINIQLSDNPSRTELLRDLSDQIYKLYLPTRMNLLGTSKGNTQKFTSPQSSKMAINDDGLRVEKTQTVDKEPDVLYTVFDTLQKLGGNMNTTSTCILDMGRLITSLLSSQFWAFQFFDASGKPGPSLTQLHFNFVGSYDQCRNAAAPPDSGENRRGFKGSYFHIVFVTNVTLFSPQFGVCLPDTCSSSEISSLVLEMVNGTSISKIQIESAYGEKLDAPIEMTAATYAAIILLSIIGFLMVVGTTLDVVVKSWKELVPVNSKVVKDAPSGYQNHDKGDHNVEESTSNNVQSQVDIETVPLMKSPEHSYYSSYTHRFIRLVFDPSSTLGKIFLAFSVYTNGKKLLNTKQNPGSLGAVHGIRFLSMSWVVLCHWYAFCIPFTLNAFTELPIVVKRWTYLPIFNGFSSVDSFFTLSGLLVSYITIKEMKRQNTAKINWLVFYFHRFWRLTPPYMFSLLVVLGLSQYLGQGPLWNNLQPGDKVACEKNWWTNLLYVNNLVNTDEICFGHTWYLANDMQFYVLSPLMLIPFYFNKFYGLLSCSVVLLTSWIATGVLSTIQNWPTTMISLNPVPGRANQLDYFNKYYIVPWCRIGPFVVGVLAGYILAMTKGRPFRMSWWVVLLGWVVSIASGLAVVYGLRGDIVGDNPSTLGAAAFYNAVSRSVWGACVCWVVIACSSGHGGPVNALLSWSPFVVLGRLTYMVYLIHLCLGQLFYQNLGALLYINDTTIVTTFLGAFAFVNMVAFVAVLALESPMLGLEKLFLKRDKAN